MSISGWKGYALVFVAAFSPGVALAAPTATLLSDLRGGSADLTRTTRDTSSLNTQTFDDPSSTSVNDGLQHGGGPGGVVQHNGGAAYSYTLQSAYTNSGFMPASFPGIGGEFSSFYLSVADRLNMSSAGMDGNLQEQMTGTITLTATERFSVSVPTHWFWDANFTQTDHADSTGALYKFKLTTDAGALVADDASGTLDGTDHITFGTLQPGTYALAFELTDSQAYGYTQPGTTQTDIVGGATFYVPEPGTLALACIGLPLLLRRRARR